MEKHEYWAIIQKLPRGAKAELARRLKHPNYFVSKMFAGERKLRQEEVVILDKFLRDYRGAKVEVPLGNKNVTVALRPSPSIDGDSTRTVRLWTFVSSRDGAGGQMSIAETTDTVPAPADLKELSKAFTIDVWDDTNGVRLPRLTTLYILRSTGRKEQWHVFGRPIGKKEMGLAGAVLGILLAQLPHAWSALVADKEVELPLADYPVAWQVKQIHY